MAIKLTEVPEKLKGSLQEGETHFTFIKKDGSLRQAVGTLNLDLVPDADKQFKNEEGTREERTDQTSYYDLEKNAWRCCKYINVTEINGEEVVE